MKEYEELYLIPPKEDPRKVVPKVVAEFENLGFHVRLVDPEKPLEGGQGTGFFISSEGHILTCAHVIGGEKEATLWALGKRYEADVLAIDADADLALIKPRKAMADPLTPMGFRETETYTMGEDVFTLGFPISKMLGNNARLTKGLLSSTKGLKDDPAQMQISAEIQPGNSGGPLFDKDGMVIGIVQQTLNPWEMAEQTGGALPQNVNFALKSNSIFNFLKSNAPEIYAALLLNKKTDFSQLEQAVVKIRSGIMPEELEKKPKLVVELAYLSIWDVWYRFRLFVIRFYDYDSHEPLFAVGQGYDNLFSSEAKVIEDTFTKIKAELRKQ